VSLLTVRHSTVYRYRQPVSLGEHRMMFRPRESHDLRLIRTHLEITPHPAHLRWLHDPFDNSVAVATFEGTTSELRFESTVTLEHFETTLPEYPLEEYARTYPFRYSDEDFRTSCVRLHIIIRWRKFPNGHCNSWIRRM
jgi:transglutaminase-like putative cysteine protease